MSKIFIIDDDRALCRSMEIQLKTQGHTVRWENNAAAGLKGITLEKPDMLFLDQMLPDKSGLDVLRQFQEEGAELPVIMITGQQDMKATIEAMRLGAFDYIRKPFEFEDLLLAIEKVERSKKKRKLKLRKAAAEAPEELRPYALREVFGRGERYLYDEICGVVVIWTKDRW